MADNIPSSQHTQHTQHIADTPCSAHTDNTSPPLTHAMFQRKPHTASATSLSVEASSSAGQGKDATQRLQIQQLKATAQNLGLPSDTVGYKMLEALATAPAVDDALSWHDVLALASSDKAVLLLPNITNSFSIPINPSQIRNHVVFTTTTPHSGAGFSPADSPAQVLAASGLRGSIDSGKIVFHGHLSQNYAESNLFDSNTRSSLLSSLPPLTTHHGFETKFPTHKCLLLGSLSIPSPPTPKLSTRSRSSSLTNAAKLQSKSTFATFFGGGDRRTSILTPSFSNQTEETELEFGPPVEITVRTIDSSINYDDVKRELIKSVMDRIRERLEGLPRKAIARVVQFVVQFYPATPSAAALLAKRAPSKKSGSAAPKLSDPETSTAVIQELYIKVRDEVSSLLWNERLSRRESADEEITEREKEALEEEVEDEASLAVERVESVVTTEIFDLLFIPTNAEIIRDDTLASRIAALNMLDLNLNHLGVQVPDAPLNGQNEGEAEADARKGLEDVVNDCGQELQKIGGCLSPAVKIDVLIQAHKKIVDGLAKLPPIRLRPESDSQEDQVEDVKSQSEDNDKGKPPSSADLILPMLIFSMVKSNPSQIISNLLFIQRFRAEGMMSGEASYALVNATAAVEFLSSVDLSELGLGGSDRIVGFGDNVEQSTLPLQPVQVESDELTSKIRSKVTGEIGDLAGSANKVFTGVVDSGWGALRGIIDRKENTVSPPTIVRTADELTSSPVDSRPQSMFNRRASSLSVASIAANVANIASGKDNKPRLNTLPDNDTGDRELVNMSSSVSSREIPVSQSLDFEHKRKDSDARSVKSMSSMKSYNSNKEESFGERMNITNRLASIPGLGRFSLNQTSPQASQETALGASPSQGSLLNSFFLFKGNHSRTVSYNNNHSTSFEPPNAQFLNAHADELRLSDVKVLLEDYKRLAGVLEVLQGTLSQQQHQHQQHQHQ
ncbi:hypothetical protein E3P77_00687 [Wallemia ichthyophaga]|nr:hypothetical protein E3P97_00818 [Wallemia ichthyophaga]TIB05876.1 hypothetical protein E3P96_00857 [Wallemia ichthyophaga]TIB35015.1 hypothetical protein E3P85_00607 [Wallemia ichthyophaga]TIB49607.1 hypothetical protein E3P82_00815 [Wallemia ichthyophaga]TIB53390.1 hypothetical protein E3P81_00817 [Wallemia ichthyophaga]